MESDIFAGAGNNFLRERSSWEQSNKQRYTNVGGVLVDSRPGSSYYSTDPSRERLFASGLLPGGVTNNAYGPAEVNVQFYNESQGGRSKDWKVRISTAPTLNLFSSGVLTPLASTNGVVFPYTPEITVSYTTNYSMQRFTHSNYSQPIYENSDVSAISINGDFTAQTKKEADYILACIYFFRSVTKMFFGQDTSSVTAGNPPPLVYLNGYGEHIFKQLPCVVTQFTHTMPADVDYIENSGSNNTATIGNNFDSVVQTVSLGGSTTRIPTVTKLSVTLQPVYSKKNIAGFNLEDFAQGRLVNKGFI